jgi:hypothetical protein
MSGYMDRTKYDAANRQTQETDSDKITNRNFYRPAVMRADFNTGRVIGGRDVRPDFSGPMNGARVNRDSFVHHRGSVLNGGERSTQAYVPQKVNGAVPSQDTCHRVDLPKEHSRLKKPLNNLLETDLSGFSMFPQNYQVGYTGPNAITGTHVQARMIKTEEPKKQCGPRTSYGNYTTSTLAQYQ